MLNKCKILRQKFLNAILKRFNLNQHQNHEKVKQSHFLTAGLAPSCFLCEVALLVLRPVFLSSPALLKITVNPSAVAGSFTSQSPNFGRGLASLFDAIFNL